jgi:hypothetical protein
MGAQRNILELEGGVEVMGVYYFKIGNPVTSLHANENDVDEKIKLMQKRRETSEALS